MAKDLKSEKRKQIIFASVGSISVILIVFVLLFSILSNRSKKINNEKVGEEENFSNGVIEQASSSIGNSVNNYEELENTNEIEKNNSEDKKQTNTSNENIIVKEGSEEQEIIDEAVIANSSESADASDEKVEEVQKDPSFTIPVEGEIVKKYGKEKLIYSDTLKEWTTHLGIDIKADKTTIVKSSADGCVKSIKNDPRYGLTVVIEHDNGFSSVYSNLLSAEFVTVGENVKLGQTIGTVGNSATFEILDDSHLHFEILKDGESIDPEMYIK